MGHTHIRQKILEDPYRAQHGNHCRQDRADDRDDAESLIRPVPAQSVPPKWRVSKRYHQFIAVASITAISQATLSWALADGVVFESNSPNYPIGKIVVSGESIELPTGEQIKILARDGEQVTIDAPAIYDAGGRKSDKPTRPSAFELAIWNKRRADIGGTRGDAYERCVERAQADPSLDVAECELELNGSSQGPEFSISYAGLRNEVSPAQPMRLKLLADFPAIASCRIAPADARTESQVLTLGPQGTQFVRVVANTPKHIPQRGAPAPKAPSTPGEYVVSCLAISSNAFQIFDQAIGGSVKDNDRELLMVEFAELRNAPVVLESFSLNISEE